MICLCDIVGAFSVTIGVFSVKIVSVAFGQVSRRGMLMRRGGIQSSHRNTNTVAT